MSMRWRRHTRTFFIYVDDLNEFFLKVQLPPGTCFSANPANPTGFEIVVKARSQDAHEIEQQLFLATTPD